MEHWQTWPSKTCVAHQTLAGARLRFNPPDADATSSVPGFSFDFARRPDQSFISSRYPLIKTFPASIENDGQPPSSDPYRLLLSSNQFLRDHYPDVDLPKEILLTHLLDEQNQDASFETVSAPKLAASSFGDNTSVLVSAGGRLSNELYFSAIRYSPSVECGFGSKPQFHATSKPSLVFATPILQLTEGPSLNNTPSFLARTYGCTSFFSSPPFGVFPTEDISVEDETNAPVPPIQFDASILLTSVTTSDTQRTPHIDACLGEDLGGKAYGTILDKKGGLWQTPGADGRTGCSRVGGVNDKDSAGGQLINWGRCGTASENGSIAVGLRASVKAIDPRAGSALPSVLLDLHSLPNSHLLTDMQRHSLPHASHLRLINTTHSIICLDHRKPGVPLISFPHHRAADMTLTMSLPSRLGESQVSGEGRDASILPVVLWSRQKNVASLHRISTYSHQPPSILGYPLAVPVLPADRSNSRCGLVFATSAPNTPMQHLSMIEMTKDGALWHQVLTLGSESLPPVASSPSCSFAMRCVWDQELSDRNEKQTRSEQTIKASVIAGLPNLDTVCRDFEQVYISNNKGETLPESSSQDPLYSLHFPRPIRFATRDRDPPIDPVPSVLGPCNTPGGTPSNRSLPHNSPVMDNGTIIDVMPTLKSVLHDSNDSFLNFDRSLTSVRNLNGDTSSEMDRLVLSSVQTSSRSEYMPPHKDPTPQSQSVVEPATSVDPVDRLMSEWEIGAPTAAYEWKDLCVDDQECGEAPGLSTRQSSPAWPRSDAPGAESDYELRDSISRIDVVRAPRSLKKDPITPRRRINQSSHTSTFTSPPTSYRQTNPSSPSQLYGESCPSFAQSQQSPPALSMSGTVGSQDPQLMAFSQILPGPHGDRTTVGAPAKKKKRVGGF